MVNYIIASEKVILFSENSKVHFNFYIDIPVLYDCALPCGSLVYLPTFFIFFSLLELNAVGNLFI